MRTDDKYIKFSKHNIYVISFKEPRARATKMYGSSISMWIEYKGIQYWLKV